MEGLVAQVTAIDTRILLGIFLAAIDLWSILLIVLSPAGRREKVLWSGIVVLCPIIGCILWFVLGPKPDLVPASEREAAGEGAAREP